MTYERCSGDIHTYLQLSSFFQKSIIPDCLFNLPSDQKPFLHRPPESHTRKIPAIVELCANPYSSIIISCHTVGYQPAVGRLNGVSHKTRFDAVSAIVHYQSLGRQLRCRRLCCSWHLGQLNFMDCILSYKSPILVGTIPRDMTEDMTLLLFKIQMEGLRIKVLFTFR